MIVASSGEAFASKAGAERAAQNVRSTAPGAPIKILNPTPARDPIIVRPGRGVVRRASPERTSTRNVAAEALRVRARFGAR